MTLNRGNMKIIQNKSYDQERALYNLKDALVLNCRFEGLSDGESALKESRNIIIESCSFSLRYPLWHAHQYESDILPPLKEVGASCSMTLASQA